SQLNFQPATGEGESVVAAGSSRLIIRTCRHILDGGDVCQAAAVGGRTYCRAHLVLRVRCRRMARARRRAGMLKLPPLMNLPAVQVGITKVRVALAANHIDPDRARLLRWAMRIAATNLRRIEQQKEWAHHASAAVLSGAYRKRVEPLMATRYKPKRFYQIRESPCSSDSYEPNTS
ncbi:MAG TPA: hypothetical protein VKG65_00295, partial [Terriglobales bacterium]|nr:hypothetical protein [Terriglobales bacterium]